jgi:hypothetical protein
VLRVTLTKRSIIDLPADAIITTIRDLGQSHNLTDAAIIAVTHDHFHHRAKQQLPLPDGAAWTVRRPQMYPVRFDNVLFVVDEGNLPVEYIVRNALIEAGKQHIETVSIAIPRFDIPGAVQLLPFENACIATRRAIKSYGLAFPNSRLRAINISFNGRDELLAAARNHF